VRAFAGPPQQRAAAEARARERSAPEWIALLEEAGALERELKTGRDLDGNDFARLALRWARKPRAEARRAVR
jgi:hypothetical protein